ncbi:hypothetical protein ACQ4PT_040971 [Festuca glaucescens]
MATRGRLAAVPEESANCSTAAYPPRSLYRDSIQRVAVSGTQIRSTLFSCSQFGHSGSSYSSDSASNSYPSNNSGRSSTLGLSAAAADFGTHELKTIAHRMVCDGYTQRMVQAYHVASLTADPSDPLLMLDLFDIPFSVPAFEDDGRIRALEPWFCELDVAWVLQIRREHGSHWQLRLQDNSSSSLQDMVERWIRGLTVIVHSIIELVSTQHEITAVVRFGKASILKMLVFFDAIVLALKAENLRAVLDMYICVRRASYNMKNSSEMVDHSIMVTLFVYVDRLKKVISSTMEKVRTLVEDDDSWATEVPQGWSEVHRNTRWIADCIVSLCEAEAGWIFISINNSSGSPSNMIHYINDLLLRKSQLCPDPSLKYLFLLNNSYFVAQMIEPCESGHDCKLTPECKAYMDSYLDVSWGDVLSCIAKSHVPGLLHCWISTPSLAKFESAFSKMYQAQKFWKVPDPRLRNILRRAITERVVSSYRDYLKEHPELAEQVSHSKSTPEVLEEMLGQLFEG